MRLTVTVNQGRRGSFAEKQVFFLRIKVWDGISTFSEIPSSQVFIFKSSQIFKINVGIWVTTRGI